MDDSSNNKKVNCDSGETDAGWPPGWLFCASQEDSRGGENTLDFDLEKKTTEIYIS